ncbi:MAG: transporter, partial [Phycisphaerales bacterium]|nr:transporter [Phycisphaerales bacterium]
MHGLTVDANPAVTTDPAILSYAAADVGGADQPAPGARKALLLLLAINLFNYIDRQILSAVEEPISREFGVSQGKMGTLMTAFLLTYMVVSPVFGWLADRVSRWLLIGVGVIVWSLASGGSGLATTFGALFLMRCLIGVGEGAYGPVAPTVISDLYPVAVRGKVLSWFYVAIPVGSALGYVFGGLFAAPGKWHWAFLMTIPPGILLGVLCFFMRERRGGGRPGAAVADAPARRATAADYKRLLRNRSYVLNCLAMTALTFALGGIAFFMPRYLSTAKGIPLGQANFWFGAVTAAAGLVATLAGGMAGDALRKRFGGAYFLVSAAGMLAGFPLFLAMLYATSPWAIWTLIFLAVFCLFFNTGPSNTALANVTHPSIRATAFAANIFVIHALGDAISPWVIG